MPNGLPACQRCYAHVSSASAALMPLLCRIAGPRYQKASSSVTTREAYMAKRKAEAWEFGSGNDYHL